MSQETRSTPVLYVDRRGVAVEACPAERRRAERDRIAAIIAAASIPDACGPDIVPAPGRGASVIAPQVTMVPNGVDRHGLDKWDAAPTGYGHRASVRAADAFDRMIASAMRRKKSCPLTPGQVAMGRRYATLVERAECDGMKLSSLEGSYGGGDSTGWIDRHLSIAQELTALRSRIGVGSGMPVRRIRPSARGETQRGPIMDRVLVDMVCLDGFGIKAVLDAHGWQTDGRNCKAALEALSAALWRMIGYRQ